MKGEDIEIKNRNRVSFEPFDPVLKWPGSKKTSRNVSINFKNNETYVEAGAYLLPYFDGSEVTFDLPAPLSTIELAHIAIGQNHAGYILPIIKSLNYKTFIGAQT
jgi:hypothetical protein